MVLDIIAVFIYLLAPQHDFHTSWMTMTLDENKKQFEVEWRTDTEHLEAVLSERANEEVHLSDSSTNDLLILLYISENLDIKFNGKKQRIGVATVEVNFSETIVHLKPIKCRRKLKDIEIGNTLLIDSFPNQSNMVQINFKGKMYSMLFNETNKLDKITFGNS